ncbi:MAG: hypothetical protein DMG35_20080 [Acidobacteria bacterium]|nr:MAG: hypothetical protein DMG35_20080 [Acidobacteriota bacterium]
MGSDPLDETDIAGNTNNSSFFEYIFFHGKRIARRDYQNNVDYYFADHLGTARVVTNAAGTILDDSDFYPFGGERPISSSSGNNYKFTGKERDPESGLDDFGARYYSSALGRWLTPDWSPAPAPVPFADLANPQTLNLYAYVNNNPITGIDPDGHMGATNSIVPFMKPPVSDGNWSQELTFSLLADHANDLNDPNAQAELQNNSGEALTPTPGTQNPPASSQPPQQPQDQQTPQSLAAQVPPEMKAAIMNALNASNAPTADDKKGGYHEESVVSGRDVSGNVVVSPSVPGLYAPPGTNPHTSFTPADPKTNEKLATVEVFAHIHPKGGADRSFVQGPSKGDKDFAGLSSGPINLVVGAADKKVYFYNGSGVIGKPMKLKDFMGDQ